MTWNLNFCAPFMPNDPTINFHRYAQATILLFYLLLYVFVHTYYKFWGPMPLTQEQREDAKNMPIDDYGSSSDSGGSFCNYQDKARKKGIDDEQYSENSSNLDSQKGKNVSLKLEEHANESCVELKKTGSTWQRTRKTDKTSSRLNQKTQKTFIQNVNINEIQTYFPIVFGHFAIAMSASIMYSPYAEQSVAALLYFILTVPLLIANSRRLAKTTKLVWGFMIFFLIFILTSSLLEVGQSNYDNINNDCFSNEYLSFYD